MSVSRVDIVRRETYADGQSFGGCGAYDRIDGTLNFRVDPDNEANYCIVDLNLSPRDSEGNVHFQSDFTLLSPRDPLMGNRRLLVDVVNRGQRRAVSIFNRAPSSASGSGDIPEGDGFLFRHGYSVVSIGWQWDVYRNETLMGLEAPQAEINGGPVRGSAIVEIRPDVLERTRLLANRRHKPYPAADLEDPDATLFYREWEDGPDTTILRDEWRFARETEDGIVQSSEHVYLESGFQPGKIYYIVYTTEKAPVVGTGLLAVRDVGAWLKHPSELNPVIGGFERVYAYGVSQTGRMLRSFIYFGLNLDEENRVVYDGLMPHVAGGRRGEFNNRFAQPSQQPAPGFGHLFPFADNQIIDPFTDRTDGLLNRLREMGAMPRTFYTNSSAEYWRGDGSLTHIDPTGQQDLDPAPETRIYHFAGTQHGPGFLPQRRENSAEGVQALYPLNIVDYRPLLRAALINLDRWVSEDVEPPRSRHPRIDDGTAVTRPKLLASMDVVPSLVKPDPERLWVLREVDLGSEAHVGVGQYPVQEGRTYPCLVAAVDTDGNEVCGIRLPDLEVPVGTHTGWNLRDPDNGAPEQIVSMLGFSSFFPATREEREATGDRRLSIQERYESRDAYLKQVRDVAGLLVSEGYVLAEDIDILVSSCAERYDAAMSAFVATKGHSKATLH